jgi:hypothetical protein
MMFLKQISNLTTRSIQISNDVPQEVAAMKDVKREAYGTRPSNIGRILQEHNIPFIEHIWFVTCRRSINPDPNTRYLVLVESASEIEIGMFNPEIAVYRITFEHNRARLSSLRNNQSYLFTRTELKRWIISTTKCKYVESFASGGADATKLSRFFRENMGKAFSLSDIDFYLSRKRLFIEEKSFVRGERGYLGEGQYYTFLEILRDICRGIDIYVVLSNNSRYHIVQISELRSFRKVSLPDWGSMIEFDLESAIDEAALVERIY